MIPLLQLRRAAWSATIALGALLLAAAVQAGPAITKGSAASIAHGVQFVLSGSGFGSKPAGPPLVWDDASGTNIQTVWTGGWPNQSANASYNIAYTAPIRGILPPHNRVNRYIAGAHGENTGAYSGYDVMVYKNITIPQFPYYLYVSWYQRSDDKWVFGGDNNYKAFNYSGGGEPYSGNNSWSLVFGVPHPNSPTDVPQWLVGDDGSSLMNPDMNGNNAWWKSGVNPMSGVWSKVEVAAKLTPSNDGFIQLWQDGQQRVAYVGPTDKMAGNLRAVGVGGFARMVGQPNNWRYFTDIYMDNSLARVVLTNSSTFSQSTIVESQLPVSWADGSITVRANLGRFSNGQSAFLYVIDASGNVSAPYAVTVSDVAAQPKPAMAKPNPPSVKIH